MKGIMGILMMATISSFVLCRGLGQSCGTDGQPCCAGKDAIGTKCSVKPEFKGEGLEAYCVAPPKDAPAGTKSVCRACGATDYPCCPDTKPGKRGSCDSTVDGTSGNNVCVAGKQGAPNMCRACGFYDAGASSICCEAGTYTEKSDPSCKTAYNNDCFGPSGCYPSSAVERTLNNVMFEAPVHISCHAGKCQPPKPLPPFSKVLKGDCGYAQLGTPCCKGKDSVGAQCNTNDPLSQGYSIGASLNATCQLPGPKDRFVKGVGGKKTICRFCNVIAQHAADVKSCPNGQCDCCPATKVGDACNGIAYHGPVLYGICSKVGAKKPGCLRCGSEGFPCCNTSTDTEDYKTYFNKDGCAKAPGPNMSSPYTDVNLKCVKNECVKAG